jgi:hypothetical protein
LVPQQGRSDSRTIAGLIRKGVQIVVTPNTAQGRLFDRISGIGSVRLRAIQKGKVYKS